MATETQALFFKDAKALAADVPSLTDDQLNQCWHSYASYFSFCHADDTARDWDLVPPHRPKFKELAAEIERRGLPKPTGNYML